MSFFRYPGGKSKIKEQILKVVKKQIKEEYREPFFGGGSIGINVLEKNKFKNIWINDKDAGISSLWTAVIRYPEDFKKIIKSYSPKISDFYEFKDSLLSLKDIDYNKDFVVENGFKKLVIHQISYSGLGTMSGSPLGGKEQNSKYKINCRWSPDYISKKIETINSFFKKVSVFEDRCTNLDFRKLLDSYNSNIFVYLDPPYYIKGNELYQYGFSIDDHKDLSLLLKNANYNWLLSYDDCKEIRELYNWASIFEIKVNYSINGAINKKEILISPDKTIYDILRDEFVEQFFNFE